MGEMLIAYVATLPKLAATTSYDGMEAAEGEIGGVRRCAQAMAPKSGSHFWRHCLPACSMKSMRDGGAGLEGSEIPTMMAARPNIGVVTPFGDTGPGRPTCRGDIDVDTVLL